MSTTETIKLLMQRSGIFQRELAAKLGIAQSTLSGKFKLDNWRESDLRKIAEICGYTYHPLFTKKEIEESILYKDEYIM